MRETVVARNESRATRSARLSQDQLYNFSIFTHDRRIYAAGTDVATAIRYGDKWKSRGGAIRFDTCRMLAIATRERKRVLLWILLDDSLGRVLDEFSFVLLKRWFEFFFPRWILFFVEYRVIAWSNFFFNLCQLGEFLN